MDLRFLSGEDEHGHGDGEKDGLLTARIIMIVINLLAGAVIFIPYTRLIKKSKNDENGVVDQANSIFNQNTAETGKTPICSGRILSFSNCFAAGMLFSLSVVHILPEALEAYGIYQAKKEGGGGGHDAHGHRRLSYDVEKRYLAEDAHDDHGGEDGHDSHDEVNFPMVFFFFVLGFMIMLLLDQVLFKEYIDHAPKND